MRHVLTQEFFNRDSHIVAEELLGKFLVRKIGKGGRAKTLASMITEVEVYDGHEDKASHASKGLTERTKVMFSHPGHWYVYLCYGIHFMLNIVTREHGYPAALLIRGVAEASGPGRLTKFLHIDKSFNGKKAEPNSGLWIEDRNIVVKKQNIIRTPRIGVAYAGNDWSNRPLRLLLSFDELK